jgi:hypothetical protein
MHFSLFQLLLCRERRAFEVTWFGTISEIENRERAMVKIVHLLAMLT